MFGKSDDKSQQEVDEILERFNLSGLTGAEKQTLVGMAKDRTLVTMSSSAITQFAFQKTLVYQNWMILSKLSQLVQNK